ncbi:MAG TPA: hypothetical protein VFW19_03545 [Allosphingosinicella sp.]|nr:hypothetical protein [Allosphingosinicella sp.]
MLRPFLIGVAAFAFVATGAEAKTPQCHDSKGHVVPCPKTRPHHPDSSSGSCVWLITQGILTGCTIV